LHVSTKPIIQTARKGLSKGRQMTIFANAFDGVKTVKLQFGGGPASGLFVTTGVAIIDFRGSLDDWTREDLEFVVPTIPTWDAESNAPVVLLDCTAVVYPTTIEVADRTMQTWFGWGVDHFQASVTGAFPDQQQVTVTARVVAKSVPSIMVRVGFAVHTVWTPAGML
jgi:hypothetical protein